MSTASCCKYRGHGLLSPFHSASSASILRLWQSDCRDSDIKMGFQSAAHTNSSHEKYGTQCENRPVSFCVFATVVIHMPKITARSPAYCWFQLSLRLWVLMVNKSCLIPLMSFLKWKMLETCAARKLSSQRLWSREFYAILGLGT